MDEGKDKTRVVTREQLEKGYIENAGLFQRRTRYEVILDLPDGTYVVREPKDEAKDFRPIGEW